MPLNRFSALAFVFSFAAALSSSAFAVSADCDSSISYSVKIKEGKPFSYEAKSSKVKILVGNDDATFSGVVDEEAVKRALIFCTPGIVKCIKAEKSKKAKKSGDLTVSFDLNPLKETSKASDFKIESEAFQSDKITKCMEEVWIGTTFPMLPPDAEVLKVSMPIKIR